MLPHFILIISFSIFGFLLYKYSDILKKIKISPIYLLYFVIVIGFIFRLYLAPHTGHSSDISLFRYWSNAATELGLFGMYSADFFLDYPPGYMYILYIISSIADIFSIDKYGELYVLMLKLPSIIADLLSGFFIYQIAKKHIGEHKGLVLSILFIFAPTIIFNSAVWGQVDSLYSLLAILSIYLASLDKVVPTAIIYGIALSTKPQSLLFGPILLYYMIEKNDLKKLIKAIFYGGLTFYIMTIPISKGYDILAVIDFYLNTFSGYKYLTVNAFNIYALFDLNWVSLDRLIYADIINTIIIPLVCVLAAYYFFTTKDKEKYLTSANLIMILFFSLCTMMHERYLFPALFISILSVAVSGKIKYLILFLLICITNYMNCWHAYDLQFPENSYSNFIIDFCAIVLIIASIYLLTFIDYKPLLKFKIKPVHLLVPLVFLTSVITFYDLGNTKTPQTFYQSVEYAEEFVISFEESTTISEVYYYVGMGDEFSGDITPKVSSNFSLFYVNENYEWEYFASTDSSSVFSWRKAEIEPVLTYSVAVIANDKNQVLSELIFVDNNGDIIPTTISINPSDFGEYNPNFLFDESDIFTKDLSYYSSTYFDEIYFARTAFELTQDYSVYETTHPHLGKYIIAIGISLFGMNPFGFRFMGAIFGILIVIAMYFLAKELFKNEKAAVITAFLSSIDCMRFTQSRIATSDTFIIFFMILTFYFMLRYKNIKDDANLKSSFLNLFLSGIFMALTISIKWNGGYPMLGLAIFFFYILFKKYSKHKDLKILIKTIFFCFFAFVFIPIIIYFVLFMPVLQGDSFTALFADFIRWQENMFDYHSQLVSSHSFASPWYTWFYMKKPIWLSITRTWDLVSSISSFGNIAIWWLMPIAIIYLIYRIIKNKDDTAVFIVISYIMCIIPWAAISRETFIYHYYPATIFGILAIGYILYLLYQNINFRKYIYLYLAIAFIVFVIYLPVAGGFEVSYTYADSLELFPEWYFN